MLPHGSFIQVLDLFSYAIGSFCFVVVLNVLSPLKELPEMKAEDMEWHLHDAFSLGFLGKARKNCPASQVPGNSIKCPPPPTEGLLISWRVTTFSISLILSCQEIFISFSLRWSSAEDESLTLTFGKSFPCVLNVPFL